MQDNLIQMKGLWEKENKMVYKLDIKKHNQNILESPPHNNNRTKQILQMLCTCVPTENLCNLKVICTDQCNPQWICQFSDRMKKNDRKAIKFLMNVDEFMPTSETSEVIVKTVMIHGVCSEVQCVLSSAQSDKMPKTRHPT